METVPDEARRALFARYADERRAVAIPGFDPEVLPHVTRHVPRTPSGEGMLLFTRMDDDDASRLIDAEIAFFRAMGREMEWKVYDLDTPADLRRRLEARGFSAHHDEVFMIRPISAADLDAGARPDDAVTIRPVRDAADIGHVVAIQEAVWECRFPWLGPQLAEALTHPQPDAAVYCAWLDDEPVGAGWIDFTPGSRFADLHGGSVLASARGRGIYARLYERRVEEALARGITHLAVDAAPMSRPILEAKGFVRVCNTYPMRTAPHAARE